jgi:hypothetical protein
MRESHYSIIGDLDLPEDEKAIFYFSIDFEPIELHLSLENYRIICLNDRYNNSETLKSTLFFWQFIFDKCCRKLNKQHRDVICINNKDLPPFGNTCLEFIGYGGFNNKYFASTKTYNFNKFYDWYDLVKDRGQEWLRFAQHYNEAAYFLKEQKLIRKMNIYEFTNNDLDSLIKKVFKV